MIRWMQGAVDRLWKGAKDWVKVKNEIHIVGGTVSPTDGTVYPLGVNSSGQAQVDLADSAWHEAFIERQAADGNIVVGTANRIYLIEQALYIEAGAATPTVDLVQGGIELTVPYTVTASQATTITGKPFLVNGVTAITCTNGAAGDFVVLMGYRVY